MSVNVATYFTLLLRRLQLDLQAARLYANSTDRGNVNESAWRQFLRTLLPSRYETGTGEVIVPDIGEEKHIVQSGQKDVIIFDPFTSTTFGWGDSDLYLFPVECVYSVMEVKTCFNNIEDIRQAARQVYEVKALQQKHSPEAITPLTVVVAFASAVDKHKIFETISNIQVRERPDFTLYFGSQKAGEENQSGYITHWHYVNRGPGPIGFVTSEEAVGSHNGSDDRLILLTLAETENALLWFYLFLIARLQIVDPQINEARRPNLWRYAFSSDIGLGYVENEPQVEKG